MSKSDRRYETTLTIDAPKDQVWRALTDADELRRWFAPDARVTPGVGGEVAWSWPDLHDWPQRIEVWEPGVHLRTRYDSPVPADGGEGLVPLFMDFHLEGERGSTTLRLVHSGFGADAGFDGEYDGISRGWPIELQSLRLYLERHHGNDRHVAWSTRTIRGSMDDAWNRLTGDDGFPGLDGWVGREAGAPFDVETPDGDRFTGTVGVTFDREVSSELTSHGGGFFRVCVEDCGGDEKAWVWVATYGDRAADMTALESRFDAMLDRLFGEAVPASASGAAREAR